MAKATYWQVGGKIDYTNAGNMKIEHGDIVPIGTRITVAGMDIPAGEKGTLVTEGIFGVPKAAVEVTLGATLYFDKTNGNVTTTATDNIPAGWAVEPAGASDESIKIKID